MLAKYLLAKHCISDIGDQCGKRQDGTEASLLLVRERTPMCQLELCRKSKDGCKSVLQGTQLSWEEVGKSPPPKKKDASPCN